MAYQLPDLAYAFDALEPHIDAQDDGDPPRQAPRRVRDEPQRRARRHGVDGPPDRRGALEPRDPARPTSRRPSATTAAAMPTTRCSGRRSPRTAAASRPARSARPCRSTFGAFDVLKQQMVDAGIKRFGSGWSWLVWDGTGLAVLSTPNQDSPSRTARPRSSGSTCGSTPTTSSTRTGAPSTSRRSGTSSTGTRSAPASRRRAAERVRRLPGEARGLPREPALPVPAMTDAGDAAVPLQSAPLPDA